MENRERLPKPSMGKPAGRRRAKTEGDRSGPVSRVLSRAAISLGRRLPAASTRPTRKSNGPGRPVAASDDAAVLPAWSCSRWGLPSQIGHPTCWCALTAPFHPCLHDPATVRRPFRADRRSVLCGTFPILADGGRYPPPCPAEPGLSSVADACGWCMPTTATARPTPIARLILCSEEPVGHRTAGRFRTRTLQRHRLRRLRGSYRRDAEKWPAQRKPSPARRSSCSARRSDRSVTAAC